MSELTTGPKVNIATSRENAEAGKFIEISAIAPVVMEPDALARNLARIIDVIGEYRRDTAGFQVGIYGEKAIDDIEKIVKEMQG